jgi:hypothetical protein
LDRYIAVDNLHQAVVSEADKKGDRRLIWHEAGPDSFLEITWTSHEVHMSYMNQIPADEEKFFEKVRNDFYEYLNTKKRLSAL